MALSEYKVTAEEIGSKGIVAAPDKLRGTAAENKALFDRLVRELVAEKLNALIDALVEELAGKMAAPDAEGVPGQYLRIGEEGVEWGVPSGSGDMIAAIYDPDGDGSVALADVAKTTEGNAATATRLQTARSFRVDDADSSNRGATLAFDGTGDVALRLPSKIKANIVGDVSGNVAGNAATAAKLQTARTLTIKDSSGSYSGGSVSFDGSGNITIKLPDSIKLDKLIAGSSLAGTAYPSSPAEGQVFFLIGG